MLAAGPPLGGRPRRAPSQGPDSNPWALAAANPSASRRGQAGNPLVPGGPAPQGHGEPEPRAEGTGAHQQPRRCPATPGRAACSAELAACFCSPEHFAGGFEGGRRPPAARPRPPLFRPLGPQPPPRLLQKGARTHRQAPGKAPDARWQDRAIGGAGRLPSSPRLPPPLLPPSLPRSLAPSLSLSAPRPRSRSASHTKFMKVLSARGAERRPIPRAAALSRAAPPPKVFSLRPTPGTILGLRPSKYLPQSPGQSSGHSRAPPGPRGLPGARTRRPTPRSPFADGGHRDRQLEACALPAGWDARTAAQSPRLQVRTPAHLLPGRLLFLLGRLDGSSLPRIAPADPAASHPETQDTILFEGWCGVPPGWSTHLSKNWGGPVAYSREGKTDVGLRQAISAWEGGGLCSPSVYTDPAPGFVENGGGTA